MEPANPLGIFSHRQKGGDWKKHYDWVKCFFFFSSLLVLKKDKGQSGYRAVAKARWRQGRHKRWDERWDEAD